MPQLLNVNNYHYLRGGAEAVYLEHGRMFGERGWGIDWFAMKHPLNPPGTDESHFAELIDLEHFSGRTDRLKAAAAIVYNRNARTRIGALIDRRRPDIAHLHNIYHHLSPSILLELKRRGVPIVLTAHDLKLACPSYKMLNHGSVCERCKGGKVWNAAATRCLKGSMALSGLITVESAIHKSLGFYRDTIDRIVTPSLFYRTKLIEWGWAADRIVYIPNFVADGRFEARPGGGESAPLFFGRLSEEKGIGTMIRAAAASGVAVTIAGTGPAEKDLQRLAAETGAPVRFVGYQSGSALGDLLHDAAAIVLPSEWYENAPMSVIESYQMGRPVAGATIGGIPELIRPGESGWLFEPGNVDALASTLVTIRDTPLARRREMGAAGFSFVGEQFSSQAYVDRMSALYAELGVTL